MSHSLNTFCWCPLFCLCGCDFGATIIYLTAFKDNQWWAGTLTKNIQCNNTETGIYISNEEFRTGRPGTQTVTKSELCSEVRKMPQTNTDNKHLKKTANITWKGVKPTHKRLLETFPCLYFQTDLQNDQNNNNTYVNSVCKNLPR